MVMILKDKLQQFIIGYPTMSDKYNVIGGILAGTKNVVFGDLVKYSTATGYYEAITSITDVNEIAGFVVSTNVKLAEGFPGKNPETKPGEAFNLLVDGYLAVELDAEANFETITPNSKVYVIKTSGKLTNKTDENNVELPNVTFTGLTEEQGSKKIAEIRVK